MSAQSFVRKKVKSLTLGEKLRQLREDRHMRVQDLAHQINVKAAYIDALEKGQYNQLPTKVYAKGFVRSYARFFGVTEHVLIALFEREYSVYHNINTKDEEETVSKLPHVPRFVFTPRVLMIGVGLVALVAIGVYLYFGIDNFVSSPWLVIDQPGQNSVISEDAVTIEGKTRNNSRVFINGQQVFVNMDGTFSEKISLSVGVNEIQVKSVNKFDKESVAHITVDAQYAVDEPVADNQDAFGIFVRTSGVDVLVNVTVDDASVYSDMIPSGDTKEFRGLKEIVITSSDGGKTLVSCDGEKFLQLSTKNVIVKDHVFDAENKCGDLYEEADSVRQEETSAE